MKSKTLLILLVLVAVIFTSASCSPKTEPDEQPPTSGEAEKTEVPPATAVPAAKESTATPKPEATATPESSENELLLSELSSLDNLDTYRIRNVMAWDEKDGESGSMEMLTEFVREPAAQRTLMKGTDDAEEWQMETIQIGDTTYINMDGTWMAMQSADQEMSETGEIWGPEDFLWGSKGKYLGKENVNGLDTKHYHYEASDFNSGVQLSDIKEAEADVWVSTKYDVYVKVMMRMVGVNPDGVESTFSIESYLTDINAPITIEAPEGVAKPGLPEDIPMMDGATDVTSLDTFTSFTVSASEDDVIGFYKAQMAAKGWTMEESMIPTMMNFTKGDRNVIIMIAAEGETTSVTIMIEE